MKVINKTSKQVIDVPSEHAQVLFTQGWSEYFEERTVIREEPKEEIQQEAIHRKEELLKRGRPKKLGT